MSVVLRLSRKGSKHRPFYHVVAIDSRKKRSGEFREHLGRYDPLGKTSLVLKVEAAQAWLDRGAQPSDTVRSLIKRARRDQASANP